MHILITIKENIVRISLVLSRDEAVPRLYEDRAEKDFLEITEEHTLSKQLLPKIDELLKRNKLETVDIKSVRVDSDRDESFTTTRIAQAVANAWNFTQQK